MESSRELTVATDKHVLPPQVYMNVFTCPTPPHPPDVYKTPRPSKGRGPTMDVSQICVPDESDAEDEPMHTQGTKRKETVLCSPQKSDHGKEEDEDT